MKHHSSNDSQDFLHILRTQVPLECFRRALTLGTALSLRSSNRTARDLVDELFHGAQVVVNDANFPVATAGKFITRLPNLQHLRLKSGHGSQLSYDFGAITLQLVDSIRTRLNSEASTSTLSIVASLEIVTSTRQPSLGQSIPPCLALFSTLHSLELQARTFIDSSTMVAISSLQHLQHLSLAHLTFTCTSSDLTSSFGRLRHLTSLRLAVLDMQQPDEDVPLPALLEQLDANRLQQLDVTSVAFESAGCFSRLTSLTSLTIDNHMAEDTGVDWSSLACLTQLQRLELGSEFDVSWGDIALVAGSLQHLTYLAVIGWVGLWEGAELSLPGIVEVDVRCQFLCDFYLLVNATSNAKCIRLSQNLEMAKHERDVVQVHKIVDKCLSVPQLYGCEWPGDFPGPPGIYLGLCMLPTSTRQLRSLVVKAVARMQHLFSAVVLEGLNVAGASGDVAEVVEHFPHLTGMAFEDCKLDQTELSALRGLQHLFVVCFAGSQCASGLVDEILAQAAVRPWVEWQFDGCGWWGPEQQAQLDHLQGDHKQQATRRRQEQQQQLTLHELGSGRRR